MTVSDTTRDENGGARSSTVRDHVRNRSLVSVALTSPQRSLTGKHNEVSPPSAMHWRDLTRYRAELRQSQNRVANHMQKLLEQANEKLASVTSNALGVYGRQMLEAITAARELAQMVRERLKTKSRNWSKRWKDGCETITTFCWRNTWRSGSCWASTLVGWSEAYSFHRAHIVSCAPQ